MVLTFSIFFALGSYDRGSFEQTDLEGPSDFCLTKKKKQITITVSEEYVFEGVLCVFNAFLYFENFLFSSLFFDLVHCHKKKKRMMEQLCTALL